jgi:hypothetical protein
VLAVNAAVASTVLALVAVLALVVNPPAPPGIAAFAPQASKPITKAPPGQSAQFGNGAGACAAGQVCAGISPTPSPTTSLAPGATLPSAVPTVVRGVPSALQCYTWPDGTVTQTFDPQSPPCIATWDDTKGNGGVTAPGVTGSEIRVAMPQNTTAAGDTLQPIVDFFNTRFQLYGRKIRLVPFNSQQATQQFSGTGFNDPAAQRADAAAVTQLKVFAATDFIDPLAGSWSLPAYRDTLTKHKIISLNGGEVPPYGTAADLVKKAPYQWTYYPALDTLMDAFATMTCRQLAGKKAQYAQGGDAVTGRLADKLRKFAVVLPAEQFIGGEMPGLAGLQRTLGGCGLGSLKVVRYDPNDGNQTSALTASFQQLKSDGVTSLVFIPFTGAQNPYSPMKAADRAQFHPEWVTVGWTKYNIDYQLNGPERQTKATFGVGTWNKMPQLELEFWYQAYQAAGGNPSGVVLDGRALYNELLLLASGIQQAGPHLTPETFAEGLASTPFPNPGAGAAPSYQATVGFGPDDASMVDDFQQFWLDTRTSGTETTRSKNLNNHKAECYAALGRRWNRDTWPTQDSYYRGPCR